VTLISLPASNLPMSDKRSSSLTPIPLSPTMDLVDTAAADIQATDKSSKSKHEGLLVRNNIADDSKSSRGGIAPVVIKQGKCELAH
jgi:hypothetical protein